MVASWQIKSSRIITRSSILRTIYQGTVQSIPNANKIETNKRSDANGFCRNWRWQRTIKEMPTTTATTTWNEKKVHRPKLAVSMFKIEANDICTQLNSLVCDCVCTICGLVASSLIHSWRFYTYMTAEPTNSLDTHNVELSAPAHPGHTMYATQTRSVFASTLHTAIGVEMNYNEHYSYMVARIHTHTIIYI